MTRGWRTVAPIGLLGYVAFIAWRMNLPWEHMARGRWTWGSGARVAALLLLLLLGLGLLRWPPARWWPGWVARRAAVPRLLRWALALAAPALLAYGLLFAPLEQWLTGPPWARDMGLVLAFYEPATVLWLGLWLWPRRVTWAHALATALAVVATLAWLDPYTEVTAYPFSLHWSEGNRLWDYSIPFGRARYLYPPDRPIPVLGDLGRMVLWGLPHLLPNAPIWLLRLWNAVLFTVPYWALAAVAFRRGKLPWARWVWVSLWGFLFLAQGPIYTPLVLSALLVAWAWRAARPFVAGLLVFLAGFYAQETRYTWIFAPAMWALMLALADALPHQGKPHRGWWRRPAWLTLAGLLGGWLVPLALGRPHALTLLPQQAQAKLQAQPLLWSRLWPNATFAFGLLPGIAIATGPALALLVWSARRGWWRAHPWTRLFMAAALAAFFVVGTIVSVKIGGGNNLHNYDMYLIGLLLALAVAWEHGLRAAFARWQGGWRPWAPWAWTLLLGPALLTTYYLSPRPLLSPDAPQVLERLAAAARDAAHQGEVLFIDQRQLLTFYLGREIPLVPEYEKKRLMNEAMSANAAYFARYYADLARHRFALIVTEPLDPLPGPAQGHFAEEEAAWDRWVTRPTLCFYAPVFTNRQIGVQLLVPREPDAECLAQLPTAPAPTPEQEEAPP